MKRGDVICVRYDGYEPFHFGVYLGEGYVVHMVVPNMFPCFISCVPRNEQMMKSCGISSGCSSKKGTIPAGFGRVQKDTIQSFDKGNEITVVPSLVFTPLRVEEILRRCEKRVGRLIKFDPVNYNCEHFANKMRYGQPVSHQVQATCAGGGAVLGGVAFVCGLTAAPALGVAAVGCVATYYIGSKISSKWSNWWRKRNEENVKQE